jgi:hypothetical protein
MPGNGWFWTGVALWALSWFLPAAGVGAQGVDVASLSGWRAFRVAWEAAWAGESPSPVARVDVNSEGSATPPAVMRRRRSGLVVTLLPWTWALNLLLLAAIGMRIGGAAGSSVLAGALFVGAFCAFGWWLKLDEASSVLKVGYYAWVASFALTGVGVVRSRET